MRAEIDGDRLDEDEILSFLFLMVVAGNETTTKLISNAWYWGWDNPGERAKAFGASERIADWVEETLRYDTSTQMLVRVTNGNVELHDTVIPEGSKVILLIGSANRDPRVFADPERYDLDRDKSQLISFGSGRHFCMGAALARLEARSAWRRLSRLFRTTTWTLPAANASIPRMCAVLRPFPPPSRSAEAQACRAFHHIPIAGLPS